MGRQLVTLALGLTLLGLGKFNDQEIIIRTNVRFECKDPRNAAAGQTMQSQHKNAFVNSFPQKTILNELLCFVESFS